MSDLKVGDKAPNFQGKNQNGETISLQDFQGKKVVLYFYPKDDTPGCTKEACNLRDHYSDLTDKGFEVIGVSIDDVQSHEKFASKYDLPFHLVADPDKAIVNQYGVYGEKNMYGQKKMGTHRTTFLIDKNGQIEQIFKKVNTSDHANQIIEKIGG